MNHLYSFCGNQHQASRVLNALWDVISLDHEPRPKDWHPRPSDVARVRLTTVSGLGPVGQDIVRSWLEDHGFLSMGRRGLLHYPGPVSGLRVDTRV